MRAPYYSPLKMLRVRGVPAGAAWFDYMFSTGIILLICLAIVVVVLTKHGLEALVVFPNAMALIGVPLIATATFLFYRKACWSFYVHTTLYPQNDGTA
jgi:hypothetical protein